MQNKKHITEGVIRYVLSGTCFGDPHYARYSRTLHGRKQKGKKERSTSWNLNSVWVSAVFLTVSPPPPALWRERDELGSVADSVRANLALDGVLRVEQRASCLVSC